jgi:hypothetical protein
MSTAPQSSAAPPSVQSRDQKVPIRSFWFDEQLNNANTEPTNLVRSVKSILSSPTRHQSDKTVVITFKTLKWTPGTQLKEVTKEMGNLVKNDSPFYINPPIEQRIMHSRDEKALQIAFKYGTESTAREVIEDIKANYTEKMSVKYHESYDLIVKCFPVNQYLSNGQIAAHLASAQCHTAKFQRQTRQDKSTARYIVIAIHPTEARQLATLKPFPNSHFINLQVKKRPIAQYCQKCACSGHLAHSCPSSNPLKCRNADCDGNGHLSNQCNKPLKCLICKTPGHVFTQCDIYTGGFIPLQDFTKTRSQPTQHMEHKHTNQPLYPSLPGSGISSTTSTAVQSGRTSPSVTSSGRTSPSIMSEIVRLRNDNAELRILLANLTTKLTRLEEKAFNEVKTRTRDKTPPPTSPAASATSPHSSPPKPPAKKQRNSNKQNDDMIAENTETSPPPQQRTLRARSTKRKETTPNTSSNNPNG